MHIDDLGEELRSSQPETASGRIRYVVAVEGSDVDRVEIVRCVRGICALAMESQGLVTAGELPESDPSKTTVSRAVCGVSQR
ncbi:MAG: hypothetical protein IPL37_11200 [Austwickia sp.]|nr:hypothetical protein [Austwickia sp.]